MKISPMDFGDAFHKLKNGSTMRRRAWDKEMCIALINGHIILHTLEGEFPHTAGSNAITEDDILAEDWVPVDPFPP